MRFRPVLALVAGLCCLVAATACTPNDDCKNCSDIDVHIPWTAPETLTYRFEVDGVQRGTTALTVAPDSDGYSLTQRTADDDGNSDEATTKVDAALKPISNVHTVIDEDQRREASATYERTDDCDAKQVVKISQNVFKPPSEPTPDSTRRSPLCVPEHSYDNDSSLFLWRAVPFEKGYSVTYNTVLSNRRATQIVTLTVLDIVDRTPLGDGEAWLVELFADQITQRAWFSTDSDHKILAYQNGNNLFLLEE